MNQQDMKRVVGDLGEQVASLLSEHADDILQGYDAAGEEIFGISIRATLKGDSDEVTRKVTLNFATEKITDLSVDKTTLRQTALDFEERNAHVA